MRATLGAWVTLLFITRIGDAQALDQFYFPSNPDIYAVNFGASHGQTFTCGLEGSLTRVDVFIGRNEFGTDGEIFWAVRATDLGVPVQGPAGILASGTFPYANLGLWYKWQSVLIPAGVIPVQPGMVFAITLSSDHMFTWPGHDGNPYGAGAQCVADAAGDSPWFVASDTDLAFTTFVQPPDLNVLPTIRQQPQSAIIPEGGSALFSVTADGSPPLRYQWRFNSSAVFGATDSSYLVTNVHAGNAGNYSVVVSNAIGFVISSNAALTIISAPAIVGQPRDQVVLSGQDATFSVGVSGSPPLSYQWRFNGIVISGATDSSYRVTAAQSSESGFYSVVVTNPAGIALSSNASLTLASVGGVGDNSLGQSANQAGVTNLIAVSAGAWHSLGLRANGRVIAWGNNENGQSAVPLDLSNVVAIAAGGYHSLAVTVGKQVVAWGENDSGQATPPGGLGNVIAVAAGMWHSLALGANGRVTAWGDSSHGQADVPAGLDNVVAIAAGGNHSLALRANGTVAAWGENTDAEGMFVGQSKVPDGLNNVVAIAAGDYHSLAVRGDGTVVAWGDNSRNQTSVPTGLERVVAAAGGGSHSVVLKMDGSVRAWGNNLNGQCSVPLRVAGIIGISAGEAHTLLMLGNTEAPPYLLHPSENGTQFTLVLQTYAGRNYTLEYRTSLTAGDWTPGATIKGNGAMQFLIDPAAVGAQRYYRVREW